MFGFFRARDRARTGDSQFGRLKLYQLSYARDRGSNIQSFRIYQDFYEKQHLKKYL